METLIQDFKHSLRVLRNSPGFTVAAIAALTLGIGTNTAIFSVVNSVLLKPAPFPDPDRLVLFMNTSPQGSGAFASPAKFAHWRAQTSVVEDVAVFRNGVVNLTGGGFPEQLQSAQVSADYFRLFGAPVFRGRTFTAQEDLPHGGKVAVLSYGIWSRRFARDPQILGKTIQLGGDPFVVIGVISPAFDFRDFGPAPDVFVPFQLDPNSRDQGHYFRAAGRLKPGITLEQARARLKVSAEEYRRKFPNALGKNQSFSVDPVRDAMVSNVRSSLVVLLGAVSFVLLIACANVANLLLVRVSLRERELAVRTALGGSRWRLVRQMLAEALLLAAVGTVLGLGLAWLGIHELRLIAPTNLPRLETIGFNGRVLLFTALAGLATALVFGMAPAWRASRPDVMHVLRASGRVSGLGGGRILRNGIVVAEVALSFVLLIGSGLMLRSFLALQRIDPGYDAHGLLTFSLFGLPGNTPAENAASMRRVEDALSSITGVEGVTAASPFPLADTFFPIRWGTEQALTDSSKFKAVDNQIVLPGYFETMRTPLLAGRTFTDADNAPDRNLVIVDQFLAAKAFPNEPAVGKRILIRVRTPEPEWVEIIGVVAHQRDSSLAEAGREQIYFTDGFVGHGAAGRWAVRTSGDPAKMAGPVRTAIAKLGGQMLIVELQPMDKWVEGAQAATRFSFLLIGIFAVIAGLLAGVGLYGVLSTAVRQRTAEIGVRMALGAVPGSIFNLVVGQGLRLSAVGIAIGLAAAFLLTRLITSLLVGVKATDPVTFAAVALMFLAVASAASWIPARRAAALDPTEALRDE